MTGKLIGLTLLTCVLSATATAAEIDPVINDMMLFGFNRSSGVLSRYSFADQQARNIGTVTIKDGRTLRDIDAAAYIPGQGKLIAFWTDTQTLQTRMVYVDPADYPLGSRATLVGQELGRGRMTGAVAARAAATMRIAGRANINPNNSHHMEFTCTRGDGSTFTRDDLHRKGAISSDGTFYQGSASYVRFRAKSGDRGTGLTVNGQPLDLGPIRIYELRGDMQVRVYNDHIKNGKAMGHWWIEFTEGQVLIDGLESDGHWTIYGLQRAEDDDLATSDLVQIDPVTAEKTLVMPLSRVYDGLATLDGRAFYATIDRELYRLDTSAKSETLVGSLASEDTLALEYGGQTLLGFERIGDRLWPVNHSNGQGLGLSMPIGMYDLGSMVLMLREDVPDWKDVSYD